MSDSKKIITKSGETMLSARKTAKRLSCSSDYVGKLCREGKLEGERVDNAWFVKESSIVAFEKARTEARVLRSQELAEERQKEQDAYKKNHGLAPVPTTLSVFPRYTGSTIFAGAGGRAAGFALGGIFLFASIVFAGQVATKQNNPLTAFFSNPSAVPTIATTSPVDNLFSSVLAFLFGTDSSNVAVQPTVAPVTPSTAQTVPTTIAVNNVPTPESVKVAQQTTPVQPVSQKVLPTGRQASGSLANLNQTFSPSSPVVPPAQKDIRVPSSAPLANLSAYVTQDALNTQLSELSNSLRQVIFSNINSAPGPVYSSGGVTNNIALSQKINSLSGVEISGGTITGAAISGGSITGLNGLDLASGCFSVAGVCITSGGNAAGSTGAIQFNTGGAFAASSTQFVWDAVNNRLGIGTSTPMQALSLGAGGIISITSNDGSKNGCFAEIGGQLQYSNDCSTYQSFTAASAGGWTDTGSVVHLSTGSEAVGIGTSTPYAKLTLWGSDTSASTNAFEIANSASTTLLAVNDAGQLSVLNLLVTGSTTLAASLTVNGATTLQNMTAINATTTNATSTNLHATALTVNNATTTALYTSVLGVGVGNYFTSLLGTGLSNNAGVLTVATTSLGLLSSTSLSGSGVISYNSSTGVFNTTPGTFGGSGTYTFANDLIALGNATTSNLAVTGSASSTYLTVSSLGGSGTSCVQADSKGKLTATGSACGSGSGAVNSVGNSDGTLTISPTTGNVVVSLNLAHANIFSGLQQFAAGASTTQLSAGLAYFGSTATSSFNAAGVLTLAGGWSGPLQVNNGVVSATSSIGVKYGGTGTSTAPSYGQVLVGNIFGGYDLVGTSSLGIVSSGGVSFGQNWGITNGYLAPTSTLGIIVAASSTIGNGTQGGGLTINGGATTTGTLNVLGIGTSTFAGNIGIAGSIIPALANTYSLGSVTNTWKDVYVGPGSLYVNGQEVLHTDGSNNVVVSSSINQNLVLQTTGTANIELNPSGTGALLVKSGITLTGGKTFNTSDSSAVLFPSGVTAGNISIVGSAITVPTLTNGGISITPNGSGSTYITNGNFGVDTTNPSQALTVQGNGLFSGTITGSNITATGTLSVAGNTTLAQATTTNLAITGIISTLLKTNASGSVVPAVAGVDYAAAGSGGANFGQSWEIANGSLAPTTTLGIIVNASSTITKLTVVNSTTTNATTTNFFATTASSTNLSAQNASTTNLFAQNGTIKSLTISGITGSLQCLHVGANGVVSGTGSDCGAGGGGSSTFLGLTDVPSSYSPNDIFFTNSAGTAIINSDSFAFDGTTLTTPSLFSTSIAVSGSAALGTVISGVWHGSVIADAYVADNLTINGGTVNNSPIGATTPKLLSVHHCHIESPNQDRQ